MEARTNPGIDYYTVAATLHGLYVAASDTLKNTLTWMVRVLAEYPEHQNRCLILLPCFYTPHPLGLLSLVRIVK